ncbi:hypothetical protein [Croceiramulus getboli]|nr:hypothetical protein P8624_08880 [Flavobacteriaceae bacterium YJPT1-3]
MEEQRYEGSIDQVPAFEIYLNLNKLRKGNYKLLIINKNKVIKKTFFSKE